MADNKKPKTRQGYPMIQGANRMMNGLNFALEAPKGASVSLLLYKNHSRQPSMEIPFTEKDRVGSICTLLLEDFQEENYEYNYQIDGKIVVDPCAYRVVGREKFGAPQGDDPHKIRAGFMPVETYDWAEDMPPAIPYKDMILYKVHVRGYTKTSRSVTAGKGTFLGLKEMIPYWKELGINAIELMPCYEFAETQAPAPKAAMGMVSDKRKEDRINYWGYLPGYYFAPKRSYCATKEPENEVRDFVKALHAAGMDCIMEMYFPKEISPMRALRALQFWKMYYHIDGFHLTGEGVPVRMLLMDGVLSETKLIFTEADKKLVKDQAEKAPGKYIAEYNHGFLQDMRCFLKSDESMVSQASFRIRRNPREYAVINYMASQDGLTMNDMVTYNNKHNEPNGEANQDGNPYNYSWNCGVEGPSRKGAIRQLRDRQLKNAFLMTLLSQGTPMIYGGDEIANSQAGNNNAYCQDNATGWVDWKGLTKNEELLSFVKKAIAFRKEHPVFHLEKEFFGADYQAKGCPDVSLHGTRAWYSSSESTSRLLGIMYNGAYTPDAQGNPDDLIYVGYNFHWEPMNIALPTLPEGMVWQKVIDTSDTENNGFSAGSEEGFCKKTEISPRTIVVLVAKQEEISHAPVASL